MDKLGGLLRQMPFIGTAIVMAFMAGSGLPGFANFPGELSVMFGAWKTLPWFVVAAAWGGLVIGGVYMLRAIRAVVHGPAKAEFKHVGDANYWRRLPFLVLLAALIWFGIRPDSLATSIQPVVAEILKSAAPVQPAAAPSAVAATH
jgi:NADH-quinone oxidoreductase subunit M